MTVALSRRRFIMFVAAAGLPLLLKAGGARARLVRWEGIALGGPASIQLYHSDETVAQQAIAGALAELRRLEAIFSVYRADSAISLLNRQGRLEHAPADLLTMLERALSLAKVSGGVYDPTVQPLWNLYSTHFAASNPDPAGPSAHAIDAALALVDWRSVEVNRDSSRIAFALACVVYWVGNTAAEHDKKNRKPDYALHVLSVSCVAGHLLCGAGRKCLC